MDYLLVAIASVLFPYILNLTGVEHQTYVGMLASLQNVNNYKLKLVNNNDRYFISQTYLITYTGYGVRPDFFIDYNLHKGRLWLSPTFGWEPLNTGIEFITKLKGGSSTTNIIHYLKEPYIGLKLGIKVFESKPELNNWYNSFGIIPYIVGGVVPVSYESEAYYQSNHELKYNFYYGAGLKIDVQGPWSIFTQYKRLYFNTNGSALENQVKIKEVELQFGIAYWFRSDNKKSKIDRIKNYNNIIHIINSDSNKSKAYKEKLNLPTYISPDGTVVKDKDITPSYNNIRQTNTIFENNKYLKENNKLTKKAQKTKAKENYNLSILNNDNL